MPAVIRLGRYELLDELGRGAMGVVYRARDPQIDRYIALKTISRENSNQDAEFRHRFYREAKAAGRLSHPGIVAIYDVSEDPDTGTPYIVMELVEGTSLSRLMSSGERLPTAKCLQLVLEVAEALAYAHSHSVIHRDIKPANILITDDGHAKINDFGVAKIDAGNLTLEGHAIGTPDYMAPEQIRGEAIDGRADIFSLGAILYQMLTGFRPFQGNSANTITFKVVNRDAIPVTALNLELTPELGHIVTRAMAKNRDERYATGLQMAQDLQDVLNELEPRSKNWIPEPMPIAPTTTKVRRPVAAIAAVAPTIRVASRELIREYGPGLGSAAALLLCLAGIQWVRPAFVPIPPAPAPIAQNISVPPIEKTSLEALNDSTVDLSTPEPQKPKRRSSLVVSAQTTHVPTMAVDSDYVAPDTVHVLNVSSTHSGSPSTAPGSTPASVGGPASLEFDFEHDFSSAGVTIWIDNKVAYTDELSARTSRVLWFRRPHAKQTLTIKVAAGQHSIRVRVESPHDQYNYSKSVSAVFEHDGKKVVHVECNGHDKTMSVTVG